MATEQSTRPSDGRPKNAEYDDDVKRRARLLWCLVESFKEVERRTGILARTVQQWKARKQPDDISWEQFRDNLNIAPIDRIDGAVTDELEHRRWLMEISHRLLEAASSALEHEPLYDGKPSDENRKQVKYLYNEYGRKIPLDGIRPASATEVVKLVSAANSVSEDQLQAFKSQERRRQDEETLFRQWYGQMIGIMYQVFDKATVEKFQQRAKEMGADMGRVSTEKPRIEVLDNE